MALMRTAKSCGPDAPTLASSFADFSAQRRWQESPVTGESTKETVKTIACGNAGCSGVLVVTTLVCYQHTAHEAAGAAAPGIPHALCFWRGVGTNLGRNAPRECEGMLFEIKSNTKHARRPGLEPGPITTGRDVPRAGSGSPFKK